VNVDRVSIASLLELQRRAVEVVTDTVYQEIGVRSFGKGLFIKEPIVGAELGDKRVFEIRAGDFIVSNVFAWEGAVGVAGPEHDGMIGSHRFMTWTPRDDVNVEYLRHYFGSEAGVSSLASASPGSAGRNRTLSIKNLEQIMIPWLSRSDQDRIVAHMSRFDVQAPDTAASMGALLERLITRAAAGACQTTIGDLMRSSRPWIEIDGAASYQAIGVRGFGRGMIRYPEVAADALSKLRYYPIEPGALIVSNIKAWEGAVCLAEVSDAGKIASNRFLQYLPTSDAIITPWVEQYLLSAEGIASLGAASPGSADRNRTLSMAAFEAIEIPVPSPKIQRAVVDVAQALRQVQGQRARRDRLAAAILPAARNEIFNALR